MDNQADSFVAQRPQLMRRFEVMGTLGEGAAGKVYHVRDRLHGNREVALKVLTNREGEPWIMRRRTQAEMDQLVEAAGFEKMEQRVDEWGIFTVSIARRVGA